MFKLAKVKAMQHVMSSLNLDYNRNYMHKVAVALGLERSSVYSPLGLLIH